jgi:hypothetical protein
MATDEQKEAAKEKLRGALKYFRLAMKGAEAIGKPMLYLTGERPDKSGQRIMSLPCDEFFADLELVIDAVPDTMEDQTDAKVAQFQHKYPEIFQRD